MRWSYLGPTMAFMTLASLGLTATTAVQRSGQVLTIEVLEVETDTMAGAPHPVPADGVFYLVRVRVTGPSRFEARLVGRDGRSWPRAYDVERILEGPHRMVFDVDDAIEAPRLEIRPRGFGRTAVQVPLS